MFIVIMLQGNSAAAHNHFAESKADKFDGAKDTPSSSAVRE